MGDATPRRTPVTTCTQHQLSAVPEVGINSELLGSTPFLQRGYMKIPHGPQWWYGLGTARDVKVIRFLGM
jgi:hypothetical protein